jgi:hypothetical protein
MSGLWKSSRFQQGAIVTVVCLANVAIVVWGGFIVDMLPGGYVTIFAGFGAAVVLGMLMYKRS